MRLIQGRDIGPRDVHGSERIAVVNESFMKRFFPGQNGIGSRFSGGTETGDTHTIVGVVSDAVYRSQRIGVPPTIYVPWAQQEAFPQFSITARSEGPTESLRPSITQALVREESSA